MIIETWMIWVYAFFAVASFLDVVADKTGDDFHIIARVAGSMIWGILWPLMAMSKLFHRLRHW